jgi:putative endonuclease
MGKQNDLGQKGEEAAAEYLRQKGYQILERNWYFGRSELDIVAMDAHTLVFAEVKTRSNDLFARPEWAVDGKKQRLMVRAAIAYMQHIGHDWAIRFDILSVVKRDEQFYIDHFKDAFFPSF